MCIFIPVMSLFVLTVIRIYQSLYNPIHFIMKETIIDERTADGATRDSNEPVSLTNSKLLDKCCKDIIAGLARCRNADKILVEDHLRTIPLKIGCNWFRQF